LIATDLDRGATVEFVAPGCDHLPVAQAPRAGAAPPRPLRSARIDARGFVANCARLSLAAGFNVML
jgi:hypothetical protein